MTQEDLANEADIDAKYLGAVERGRENISIDRIGRLAEALHVDARDFFRCEELRLPLAVDGPTRRIVTLLRNARHDKKRLMVRILRLIAGR